ncbi:TPA: amidohydrolase family protein [Clostridioides difficile]|nr:amidohydrolase family protein [Clostridioides difficile]
MNKKYIKAGNLIDGTGNSIMKNKGIIIDGDTIVEIEDIRADLNGYDVYDYLNKTVMPGIMNCHVHLTMEPVGNPKVYYDNVSDVELVVNTIKQLDAYLDSGVTYIRSLGCPKYVDVQLKNLIDKGSIDGPGIVTSGPVICMTGGHGYYFGIESDGVDECRKSARTVLKNGVDCVKIMATGGVTTDGVEPGSPQLTLEEMKAAVDEAIKAGKITATHGQGRTGIKNAVLAGITSIEHGVYLDDEIIDLMLERGTYLVPTVAAPYFILNAGKESGITEATLRKCEIVAIPHKESFLKAYKKGIKIAVGSDAGTSYNEHGKTYYEMKLMSDYGMDNMDVIVAATKTASELLKIDKNYGTLEKGKKADVIVVNGNPIEDIDVLADVLAVFKLGKKVR